MTVELKRGLSAVVPQALAHRLDVDTRFEQECGIGVAKAMQRDRRHSCQSLDSVLEASTDYVRVLRETTGPAEDYVQVSSVRGACSVAIESLARLLFERNPLTVSCVRPGCA